MKLAIYNHGIAFDGSTPYKKPLGGSETGIVYMARELVRCGHDVTVYCNCEVPGDHHGVGYLHYHQFFSDYQTKRWDALISFRSFDPFLVGRVAPRMIFWTGDAFDQPALNHFAHPSIQDNIDLIFCVSNWHRETFVHAFGLAPDKIVATRNGFNPELIHTSASRRSASGAYTSTPFRGLDILLGMFPEIRRQIPAFELKVFSSMKVYGWNSEQDEKAFGATYQAARAAGIDWHGSVAQPVLMEHLAQTGLLLYPNTFDETSCIAAIEAQASGCVVVTSAKAALNETVENEQTGICVKGDPRSEAYQREFISRVCWLIRNPGILEQFSNAARHRAFSKYTWGTIAGEWTQILEELPAKAVHGRFTGPLTLLQKSHNYLRNGNVSAAARVLAALEDMPFLKNEVEILKGQLSTCN